LYPVLFRLGPFSVSSYTALLDIGLVSGALIAYLATRRRGLDSVRVVDAALAAAMGGVIGARVVYVVVNWAYYSDHLRQVLRLRDGGLSWHGGFVGGLVALLAYCSIRRTSPQLTLSILTPGAALLAVCAWVGCFLVGCAPGVETYPGQGLLWMLSMESPDLYGIWAPRVAVQLLGAGWGAVVWAVVVLARQCTWLEGLAFPLWLALYSAGLFGLGFLRADEVPLIAGWRADQVADLTLALIGAAALAVGLLKRRHGGKVAH
jgi:phosphatidylglycerol:prolipoprotein diacylglycerol transferase